VSLGADIERIVARDHHDPHSVLGAHSQSGGVVVRAFRPGATAVRVRPDGTGSVRLRRVHRGGLYEGTLADAKIPLSYRIEAAYPDGVKVLSRDPYAFPPTLGPLDLYLAGEGRHEELYEHLGAHPRELDGVNGTAFAVWAPAARSVSVVGDFIA